jgi:hypothetical protein
LQEKGQLTVKEAADSRLVTKCRFIVERKLGEIKRHKALDHRRNVEVGHLQIDYRNLCAILNFNHKPCASDCMREPEKIAERMLSKAVINENQLVKLLKIGLNQYPSDKLERINDFPKISKQKLISKIFFGSYYIKQANSYIEDLLRVGRVHYIDDNTLQKNGINLRDDSKVIAMHLTSRHSRRKHKKVVESKHTDTELRKYENFLRQYATLYKVYVQYVPNYDKTKAIIGKNQN